MSKKKSSGLSKKVPAIFEGIPNIESASDAAAKKNKPPFAGMTEWPSLRLSSAGLRLLFEVSDQTAKVMVVRKHAARWEVDQVVKFRGSNEVHAKSPMDWPAFTRWLKERVVQFASHVPYEARLLFRHGASYVTQTAKPEVPARELREALVWQIADNLSFPVETSELRYEDQGDTVLVSVLERQCLESALKCFHDAGIFPEVVTLLPFAYQALDQQYSLWGLKSVLVVHIAGTETSLMVFHGGRLYSLREISSGGEHVTQSIMGTLVVNDKQIQIGYEEGRLLKESLGLPTPQLMPDPEEPKHSQLAARMRPIFEKLTNELRSTIAKFRKEFPGEVMDNVYLAGGGSEMKGLTDYFAGQLDLAVEKLDISKIDPKLDSSNAGLFGLAYAAKKHFNFSSTEDLWKPRFEWTRELCKRGILLLATSTVLLVLVMSIKILVVQKQLKTQESVFRQMGATDLKIAELDDLLAKIAAVRQRQKRDIVPEPQLGEALRELSQWIPSDVVFHEMIYRKHPLPSAEFKGFVSPMADSPDAVLSDFLDRLNRSSSFRHSRLETRGEGSGTEAGLVEFAIKTEVISSPGGVSDVR